MRCLPPRAPALPCLLLAASAPAPLAAQADVPLWRVEPVARAGAVDGPGALSTVGGVTVGRDGTLYVAQPREQGVKVFDTRGRYLRSIGREGSGPGEFESPYALGWRGDSLWVGDSPQARISVFAPDRTFARTIGFSRAAPMTGGRIHIPGSLLADGSVLGHWRAPLHELVRGTVRAPLVRFSAGGEPRGVLAWLERSHDFGEIREGDRRTYYPQPFVDAPLTAVAPDGSGVVVVRRDAATSAGPATFSVQRILPSGAVAFSRRYQYRPLPLANADVNRAIEKQMEGMGAAGIPRPEDAALRRVLRQTLYRPRFRPPVSAVQVGRDGTIWLRREDLGRSHTWWHVLDARGRLVARAWVPSALDVRYADATQLWAVELDALDVPTLVRLRVVPAR